MRNFRLSLFAYVTRTSIVKCDKERASSGNNVPEVTVPNKILQAKVLLGEIKDSWNDKTELNKLDFLLSESNREEKQQLFLLLEEALKDDSGFSTWDKKDILKLKRDWEKSYALANTQREAKTYAVIQPAQVQSAELRKSVNAIVLKRTVPASADLGVDRFSFNDADPRKTLDARLRFLTDFDNISGVENKNKLWGTGDQKYVIGEKQAYEILKDTLKDPSALSGLLYHLNVTEDWTTEGGIKKMHDTFRDNLMARANNTAIISGLVLGNAGARAGLVSVLQWKEDKYIEALLKDQKNLAKIQTELDKNTSNEQNILLAILSVGIGVASLGRLRVSYETRDIDLGSKGHPLSAILGDRTNFTAKARILEWAIQANGNDRETQIIQDTGAFITKLTKAIEPRKTVSFPDDLILLDSEKETTLKLVETYNKKLAQGELPKEYHQALIDTLAHNHMLALAKQESGWDAKGLETGLSLFNNFAYIGFTVQNIGTRVKETGGSGATYGESLFNATSANLSDIGVVETIDKQNGNGIYTLPFSLPADRNSQEYKDLIALGAREQAGKVTIVSDIPLSFHQNTMYRIDGTKELILTVKKSEKFSPVPLLEQTKSKDVQAARNIGNMKNLPLSIYKMSRNKEKYPQFDTMIRQVGNRDYDVAYGYLKTMAQKGDITSKNILSLIKVDTKTGLSNRKEVLMAINTYTYGGVGKNTVGSMNHKDYVKNRKGTMGAENRFSKESVNKNAEAFFLKQSIHTPKHISEILPGQALAISVFATPRGGTHRIDKFDGSVQVAGNLYTDGPSTPLTKSQKEFIITTHGPEIRANLQVLNASLQRNGLQISEKEYTDMLMSGQYPESLEQAGYVMKNKAVFFEARAMINWNVCMNKVQGIAFPTFEGLPVPVIPTFGSDATVGLSGPVGNEVVVSTEIDPGINLVSGIGGIGGGGATTANTSGGAGVLGNVPVPVVGVP